MYDLIIIGMGISGISAAVYAKRNNMKVLMIEKNAPGGLLNQINIVENYPGYDTIVGTELSYKLFEQINYNKIEYVIDEVINVENNDEVKKIITKKKIYEAKKVIIASGRIPRRLEVTNEDKFIKKGISNCALCDGNLYKNKDIAVIGGGNSALEEALYLSKIVNKISLIHRNSDFKADEKLIKGVKDTSNIDIIYNSNVTEFIGDDKLEGIVLNNGKTINIDGVFEYVGYIPKNDFIKELDLVDSNGYITVNDKYQTKVDGIYAVGDCIKKDNYQLITGASDGAACAIEIIKTFNN